MKGIDVNIYTDGACSGNPGKGGFGVILESPSKRVFKEFAQGYKQTTNNRMELLAIIEGLKKLKTAPLTIQIFSDSKYVVDAVEKKWLFDWEKKQFKGRKNEDLWREFLTLYRQHRIYFSWVRGHNGHPQNERCDRLAVEASQSPVLKTDYGFKKQETYI